MSKIQALSIPVIFQNSVRPYQLFIYRGDLEHAHAPGNKWHKLKYHLQEARRLKARYIATFGGPYSNHLHAFASTLIDTGFTGIAVVRGELHPTLTPTLIDVAKAGVELWPCSRKDYRLAEGSALVKWVNRLYSNVYWIPEGGGGPLGLKGCRDWAEDISNISGEYDAWCVAAGTGTTAAGLLAYENIPHLHVVSALKGAKMQENEILEAAATLIQYRLPIDTLRQRMTFHDDAHEGGYAKHSAELRHFLQLFAKLNPTVELDPVYTCKVLFSIMKKMRDDKWPHSRTLLIHTGGIQGWRGYPADSNPFVRASVDSDK